MMDVLQHALVFVQDVPLLVMLQIVIILAIIPVVLLVQEPAIGPVQEDVAVTLGTIDNMLVYRCHETPIHKFILFSYEK